MSLWFIIILYFVMGFISAIIFSVVEKTRRTEDSDSRPVRLIILVLWPIVILILIILKLDEIFFDRVPELIKNFILRRKNNE